MSDPSRMRYSLAPSSGCVGNQKKEDVRFKRAKSKRRSGEVTISRHNRATARRIPPRCDAASLPGLAIPSMLRRRESLR